MSQQAIRSLGVEAKSRVALGEVIHSGIPASKVKKLLQASGWTKAQLFRWAHIPPATGNRRFAQGRFDDHESERIARLARALDAATDLFRDVRRAAEWMQEPNPRLGGRSPAEACGTELGARETEALIGRVRHGVY